MDHSRDAVKYTCCGYHCTRNCPLKVRVRDGQIVACEPDDTINPRVPREDGYLPETVIDRGMIQVRACNKAYAQAQMVNDPARVRFPMKRVGARGEGEFTRISWDEALDTIAQRLAEAKRDYGPYSIIHHPYSMFGTSSFPLAPWFGAGIAGWGAHSANGWEEPEKWVLGTAMAQGTLRQDEIQVLNSKLIVLWGLNPLTTHFGAWAYNLLRARERGIPIICIEARYTTSAEVLADQWIPVRPSTDVAMMIAMANVLLKEDLCDQAFIKRWVEPDGLEKWKRYVLGMKDGVDKTPEWAEGICGVPAITIAEFARLYARSKPVNLNVALSMGRQFYGENACRASMYLQALTGNIGIPGATAAAQSWPVGRSAGPMPKVDWRRAPAVYDPPTLMAAFKWPKAVELREKLDKGKISKEEYNSLIGNKADNPAPNVRVLIEEGVNHVVTMPDVNANLRAVQKLDFLLVFGQYPHQDTSRCADILLPQIYTAFEGRNCHGVLNYEDLFRMGGFQANHFLFMQKCLDPVGEVKTHDWVWTQIAKRLGIGEQYNPRMVDVPDDRWEEEIEALHREAYETWAKRVAGLRPPSWESFQEKPVYRYEIKDPYYPFKKALERGENPFSGTPSGKIEFLSEHLSKGSDYVARHDYPEASGHCYGKGSLPPTAQMVFGGNDTFHSQDVGKFPILMSSPHSPYRLHTFLGNNPLLNGDCYEHAVWMSVADAKARGIKSDDVVRVHNDIGEVILPAYVTSKVVPGTACIFHGSWYKPGHAKSKLMPSGIDFGGAANMLIHNEDVPNTVVGMFPCKGNVQIEKWEGGE